MPNGAKWPFDGDDHSTSKEELDRAREKEHARLAAEATRKQRLRHDRLIIGGRAHTKKPGLS
jgi:predicted esterase